MRHDIVSIYRTAIAFALACPLLFFIPVAVELAQHIAEIHGGMYDSMDAARATADDPGRMAWGYAKTLALQLPGYWFARYMLSRGDAAFARQLAWPAIGLWLVLFAANAAQLWLALFGPSLGQVFDLAGRAAIVVTILAGSALAIISIYLSAWVAAWPLGNFAIGPLTSIRIMVGSFWRSLALLIAGVLPLMAVHYALGLGAIGLPAWLVWPMMLADAVVVGFLALTMTGAVAAAARYAAGRKGVSLMPPPTTHPSSA